LLKALLLNGATKISVSVDKTPGVPLPWSPGQVSGSNPNIWIHPLNYAVGSGELNTLESWRQMREQTTGNTRRWWDEESITKGGQVDYQSNLFPKFSVPRTSPLTSITATLTWDRHVDAALNATPLSQINLDLYYSTDNGATWNLILGSESPNDSVEQIYLPNLPFYGPNVIYDLRVTDVSMDKSITLEPYALAVTYSTAPEPATVILFLTGGTMIVVARRWRRGLRSLSRALGVVAPSAHR
jgi:hypothetical protein